MGQKEGRGGGTLPTILARRNRARSSNQEGRDSTALDGGRTCSPPAYARTSQVGLRSA